MKTFPVQVLKENCADGWTIVQWDTGKPMEGAWFGTKKEIGYIWQSFLERFPAGHIPKYSL
ncbi:MAG: hypothetical protein IJ174_00445 [Clostridia bacterium]|nr:hypothetical protein [Clostridia bacterium]